MSDLVFLIFGDGSNIRCANITDAKNKDIAFFQSSNLEAVVGITPAGGGLLTTWKYSRTLCRLFSPEMFGKHLPYHRQVAAYRATSQLAHAMERLATGKRARKFLGIFG